MGNDSFYNEENGVILSYTHPSAKFTLNIFYSWGEERFVLPAAAEWSQGEIPEREAKVTSFPDPDLFLLSQRKKES